MSSIDTTRRHYRDLLDSETELVEGEHPADKLVAELAEVSEIDRAVRAMSTELGRSAEKRRDAASWTDYEDLRFQQRCLREERFFDVGYEMGWSAGVAQYAAFEDGKEPTALRGQVHRILVSSDLSGFRKAMVLLEVARAFFGAPDSPSKTG